MRTRSRWGLLLAVVLLGCGDSGAAGGAGGSGGIAHEDPTWLQEPVVLVSPHGVATVTFRTRAPVRASFSGGGATPVQGRGAGTSFSLSLALQPGQHRLTLTLTHPPSAEGEIHFAHHRIPVEIPERPRQQVVLFDAAHGQTAGNADWVVDDPDSRLPSPADPADAEAWSGAYSSFGFGLHETGRFAIRTLPRGARFDPGELEGVSVVVLPEPNRRYEEAEKAALWDFVRAGGGLYLLANHAGADRDNDGWDAAEVAADLLAPVADELGIDILPADVRRETPTHALVDHPLLTGPWGAVHALSFYNATTLVAGSSARPLVHRATPAPGLDLLGAAGTLGAGRVLVVGDSAGADDGTGAPGKQLFDGWSEWDNAAFYLNGISWLAGEIRLPE